MKNDNRQKSNAKKIIKIVFIILYQLLVIMALILTMVIVLQRVTNSNGSIGGYKIFRVITGSMEPEYEVGEVVISKEIDPKDIEVGDDIVYLGKTGEYAGKIIMHNVVGIDTNQDGRLTFHAKGLQSNSVEDPQISEEQIYGVVKYRAHILTILYNLATNIYSIFFIIIILVLNVFIAFNTPKKSKKSKKRKVKQIANNSDAFDNVSDEDFEEVVEEDIEETEDEFDEEADDEEETYDVAESEEDIEEKIEKNQDEDIEKKAHEKIINEKMREYYNKTINHTKNNAQEKKGRNKNK